MEKDKLGKIYFRHVRNIVDGKIDNMGGATIAYQEISPNIFKLAISRCHPKDNFDKKLGRIKSSGRLNSPDQSYIIDATWKELHEIFPKDMEEFYNYG